MRMNQHLCSCVYPYVTFFIGDTSWWAYIRDWHICNQLISHMFIFWHLGTDELMTVINNRVQKTGFCYNWPHWKHIDEELYLSFKKIMLDYNNLHGTWNGINDGIGYSKDHFYLQTSAWFGIWIDDHTHCFMRDVITHPLTVFND